MIAEPQRMSGKKVLTIAVCGSAKKHRQSFEALRKAAVRHNTVLREFEASHRVFNLKDDCYSNIERTSCDDLTDLNSESEVNAEALPISVLMLPCFFRFVSLNYDAHHQRMVLDQTFAITEDSVGEGSCLLPRTRGGDASYRCGFDDEHRHPNESLSEIYSQTSDTRSSGRINDLSRDNGEGSSVRPEDVDIILHKITTYGLLEVSHALHEWCDKVRQLRMFLRRPPLIVLDPIDKIQVLSMRSMVYDLLDGVDNRHHSLILIPHTFHCKFHYTSETQICKGELEVGSSTAMGTALKPVITPIDTASSALDTGEPQRHSASHFYGGKWWVAKPDECTGPTYTHDLVIWKSSNAEVCVPPQVRAALAVESSAYIIQEFYACAFPVVVKVYCVGSDIFIKVKPTNKLLSLILDRVGSKDGFDRPVRINSQNKELFSLDGLSLLGTGAARQESLSNSPYNGAEVQQQETPLSFGVLTRLWETFFAVGTPAWTAVARLVEELSSQRGLGLNLYGFDILLVPSSLAHRHQVEAYPKGIGYTKGSAISYQTPPVVPSTTDSHNPDSMFDPRTGAPTTYLMGSVPVIIDVNYFPGYSGMDAAMRSMLKVMWGLHNMETPTEVLP